MPATRQQKGRTWPIRAIAVLLLLQSLWLIGISINNVAGYGPRLVQAVLTGSLSPDLIRVISISLPLTALALLAILGAISFFLLLSFGWLTAMVLQSLTLLNCLSLYFSHNRPGFIYPTMLYCILMVLYLNSSGVQTAFRSRQPSR